MHFTNDLKLFKISVAAIASDSVGTELTTNPSYEVTKLHWSILNQAGSDEREDYISTYASVD